MHIENDIKLGFKDVMIRPKRSTLKSRSEVLLNRKFHFKHSNNEWDGVPIIAANMDTVGTFEMAQALSQHQVITAIHKHYAVEQWKAFVKSAAADITNYICVSTGTSKTIRFCKLVLRCVLFVLM
ncbi:MAG: IMP dehydrogenase [Ferruginibacter sp.]